MSARNLKPRVTGQPAKAGNPPYKRVMVIDDNKVDLFVNSRIIKKSHLTRTVCSENKACKAIERLKNTKKLNDVPELIFINLKMNDSNGFNFMEEFKKLSEFIRNKCKIIVLSPSNAGENNTNDLQDPQILRFFQKPLNASMIKNLFIN